VKRTQYFYGYLDVYDEYVSVSPVEKKPQEDDPTRPYETPKVESLISFLHHHWLLFSPNHQVNWIH